MWWSSSPSSPALSTCTWAWGSVSPPCPTLSDAPRSDGRCSGWPVCRDCSGLRWPKPRSDYAASLEPNAELSSMDTRQDRTLFSGQFFFFTIFWLSRFTELIEICIWINTALFYFNPFRVWGYFGHSSIILFLPIYIYITFKNVHHARVWKPCQKFYSVQELEYTLILTRVRKWISIASVSA